MDATLRRARSANADDDDVTPPDDPRAMAAATAMAGVVAAEDAKLGAAIDSVLEAFAAAAKSGQRSAVVRNVVPINGWQTVFWRRVTEVAKERLLQQRPLAARTRGRLRVGYTIQHADLVHVSWEYEDGR
jgi:hypothetical protein